MKTNKIFPIILIISLVLLNSCGVFQKGKKDKPNENNTTAGSKSVFVPQKTALDYLNNAIKYETFNATVNAEYNDGTQEYNGDIIVKSAFQKESQLSIRAGMMGISAEIASVLANMDSIFAVNKIQVTYYKYSFDQAASILKAPIDFVTLQNLLVGNPLIPDGKIKQFMNNESQVLVAIEKEDWIQTLLYSPSTMDLQKVTLINSKKNFECTILFEEYENYNAAIRFSRKRDVVLKNDNKVMNLSLYYQNYKFNDPIDIKFNIPKTYRSGNHN